MPPMKSMITAGIACSPDESLPGGRSHGSERIAKAVLASSVPPYLYKTVDNPEGALDDVTIGGFEPGVRTDRVAFLGDFTTGPSAPARR